MVGARRPKRRLRFVVSDPRRGCTTTRREDASSPWTRAHSVLAPPFRSRAVYRHPREARRPVRLKVTNYKTWTRRRHKDMHWVKIEQFFNCYRNLHNTEFILSNALGEVGFHLDRQRRQSRAPTRKGPPRRRRYGGRKNRSRVHGTRKEVPGMFGRPRDEGTKRWTTPPDPRDEEVGTGEHRLVECCQKHDFRGEGKRPRYSIHFKILALRTHYLDWGVEVPDICLMAGLRLSLKTEAEGVR